MDSESAVTACVQVMPFRLAITPLRIRREPEPESDRPRATDATHAARPSRRVESMTKIVFTCDCGKTVRIDKCHAGRRGRCPYCKAMIDIPAAGAATTEAVGGPQKQAAARRASTMADVDAPVSVERSLAPRMRANRLIAGKLCTICQTKIDAGEEVRKRCTRCHSSFHVSCWDEVGGCGTYGCEEAPGATSSSGSASATGAGTSQPKAPSPEQLTKGASTMAAPAGRRCRPHGYRAVSAGRPRWSCRNHRSRVLRHAEQWLTSPTRSMFIAARGPSSGVLRERLLEAGCCL